MLPKGYLIGNLTADPVSGITSSSTNYVRFSIACSETYSKKRPNPKSHFYNCVAWLTTAQYISNYSKKGDKVFIEFQLRTNSYTNADGRVIKTYDLIVEKIETLIKKEYSKLNNENKNYVFDFKKPEKTDVEKNLENEKYDFSSIEPQNNKSDDSEIKNQNIELDELFENNE